MQVLRELPAVSPQWAYLFALTRAIASALPERKRELFLDAIAGSLDSQLATYQVVRLRTAREDGQVVDSVGQAMCWFERARPAMSKLPPL